MKKELLLVFAFLLLLLGLAIVASIFFAGNTEGESYFFAGEQIAVIPLKGEIASEQGAFSSALSSQEVIDRLEAAENDSSVGAILLDIDSPGGTIVSTKQIVAKVRQIKKPIVSWIGETGASGAYYIAAASDYIIADEDSITGSIGVLSVSANIEGLLEKIGVKVKILKEGKFKSMGSPYEEMTPEEEQLIQTLLSEAFSHFKRDILSFRKEKLSAEKLEEIADGRILSGSQAKQLGLIDELGTREQAIQKTASLAGIKGKPITMDYSKKQLGLFSIFSEAGKAMANGFLQNLSENSGNSGITELKT